MAHKPSASGPWRVGTSGAHGGAHGGARVHGHARNAWVRGGGVHACDVVEVTTSSLVAQHFCSPDVI